jgi:hypothetical protein
MTLTSRIVAASMVASLLVAGPLAPMAVAQQPAPAQPAQPDMFREVPKTHSGYQPTPAEQALEAERVPVNDRFYEVAAGVATSVLIPGKAITCVLGSGIGFAMLALTFGSGYRAATRIAEEGCAGKWIVGADDIRPDTAPIRTP